MLFFIVMTRIYRTLFGVYLKGHILSELVVELVDCHIMREFISEYLDTRSDIRSAFLHLKVC